MNDDDKKVLLTVRSADCKPDLDGTIMNRCTLCGESVWVAPSSMLLDYEEIWCLPCVKAKKLLGSPDEQVIPRTDEQKREWPVPDEKIMDFLKEYLGGAS